MMSEQELGTPEQEAAAAVTLLPCPVCSSTAQSALHPRRVGCENLQEVAEVRFWCTACKFTVVTKRPGFYSGWRDGALEWNREARKR